MIRRFVFLILLNFATISNTNAQGFDSYDHLGEIGFAVGVAHYFGDLNNEPKFNKPKGSFSVHYTKQFNDYIGIKLNGTYAFLAYADKYSDNPIQRLRNLSFNTDIYEMSVSGIFNFYRFNPAFDETCFTPYVGIGIGMFSYDPYTFYQEQKYYLRPLGTEGQGSEEFADRKPYSNNALCIPLTLGVKYAFNRHFNIFAELKYRFTNTDYLDDVSKTYEPTILGAGSDAQILSDRSTELGLTIGKDGRQRGNSLTNDSWATFHVGISFNFNGYRCPNLRKML